MKKLNTIAFLIIYCFILLVACNSKKTEPPVTEPGSEKSGKTKALETGAALLQSKEPVDAINMYLNGFHFYNGDIKKQMEAHHFCSKLNEDVTQCIIYDGNKKDAHIMGVEYIISSKLFKSLPKDEKQLWHSHQYEVKSGELVAPGIPEVAEHALMEQIATTYGKTWHTWHTDLHKELPFGSPLLMMGFTKEGQIDNSMVSVRDSNLNVSTKAKKENRKDIADFQPDSDADSWQNGKILQIPSLTKSNHH